MKMTKKELLDALKDVKEALDAFRPEVDALLGAMGEFYYESPTEEDEDIYSEEFLEGIEALVELYDRLPTWSEVDDLENMVSDMINEIE